MSQRDADLDSNRSVEVSEIMRLTADTRTTLRAVPVLADNLSNATFSLYDYGLIMLGREEIDPLAPQREAAMFYGLFLRGHPAEALREDIDVPKPILAKWLKPRRYEDNFRDSLRRMYAYRKQVLAIFDELVFKEKHRMRVH